MKTKKLPLLALGALLLSTAAGCAPDYDHTEFTATRASSLGGRVDRMLVTVPEGMIVTSHVVPFDDDSKAMSVTLRSKDDSILGVEHVITPNDFAFIGNKIGATEIQVLADNALVMTITATVTPQP